MEFASFVLMEIDPEDKKFIKEMGSYEIEEGGSYITRLYYDGKDVIIHFGIAKEVEDWEFSAIFDLFKKEAFQDKGFYIEDMDEDYNPAWLLSFPYIEDRESLEERLNDAGSLIEEKIDEVLNDIVGKEEDYK